MNPSQILGRNSLAQDEYQKDDYLKRVERERKGDVDKTESQQM